MLFDCSLISVVFYAGIFIGITLGISSNTGTVQALMIALFFHQGNEGLALGVLFVKAGYGRLKYMLLAAAWVLQLALGLAAATTERARLLLAQKELLMLYQQAF